MEIATASKHKAPLGGHLSVGWIVRTNPRAFRDKLIVLSVCIASIIRAAYVGQISLTDPSWSDALGAMWTVVELSLGVVSACLPTLRPLVVRSFKSRTATFGMSRESRLENQDRSRMLHRLNSATKGRPQRNGLVNDSQPLDAYESMPSDERLILVQAHLANDEKGVRGARSVGEATAC